MSFLTGRYPSATGIRDNAIDDPPRYEADLFDVLESAGYATALLGKNHSHLDPARPDHAVEMSHWDAPARTDEEAAFDGWIKEHSNAALEPTPFDPEVQYCARAVEEAIDWISGVDDPFGLWLSVPEPHNPYQVPEPYHSTFDPADLPEPAAGADAHEEKSFEFEWARELAERRVEHATGGDASFETALPRLRANYYGMLRLIDDQVRRFVTFLEDAGLRDETLLVFTSDHGDFVGECNTYTQAGATRMVRKDEWKLVYDAERGGELYYLPEDPAQLDDRYEDAPGRRRELLEELATWSTRTTDPLPLPPRYEPRTAPHNWWSESRSE